jgi:hypothetical protein
VPLPALPLLVLELAVVLVGFVVIGLLTRTVVPGDLEYVRAWLRPKRRTAAGG